MGTDTLRVHECPRPETMTCSKCTRTAISMIERRCVRDLTWTGTSVCHLMQNMYSKCKCELKLVHVSDRTLMQMVNVTRELTLYYSIKVFNWNRASYKYRPQRGNISCSIVEWYPIFISPLTKCHLVCRLSQ